MDLMADCLTGYVVLAGAGLAGDPDLKALGERWLHR